MPIFFGMTGKKKTVEFWLFLKFTGCFSGFWETPFRPATAAAMCFFESLEGTVGARRAVTYIALWYSL
jgi:hypothetical protein